MSDYLINNKMKKSVFNFTVISDHQLVLSHDYQEIISIMHVPVIRVETAITGWLGALSGDDKP